MAKIFRSFLLKWSEFSNVAPQMQHCLICGCFQGIKLRKKLRVNIANECISLTHERNKVSVETNNGAAEVRDTTELAEV